MVLFGEMFAKKWCPERSRHRAGESAEEEEGGLKDSPPRIAEEWRGGQAGRLHSKS
jgi:hypothetical protein